ncbi:protein FAM107B-like [Corticium candelabrum]|uniref:protein FAM107B-like n=1 Tax=Corticium candelabrum TaxID=121492 RepID=UPI002E256C70|nr:protein FAM107B-like [Corticium candelabrum]
MEQEEIWVARHDYVKERDDVLSFHKGDRFKVMSKSNDQWWAVKNLATYDVGYAPATYLELVDDATQACKSIDDDEPNTVDIRKKLLQVTQRQEPPNAKVVFPSSKDDVVEVLPRKVSHLSTSTSHKHLHKELQLSNKLGGTKQLGKPELQKVMDRRRPDSEGRPGTITGKPRTQENLGDKELASRLTRQSKKLELASESSNNEAKKPEFMKIALNKIKSSTE